MRTSDEISLEINEKEKELRQALDNVDIVSNEVGIMKRKIKQFRIEIGKIELELITMNIAQEKAEHNISKIRSEIKSLERDFWIAKGQL